VLSGEHKYLLRRHAYQPVVQVRFSLDARHRCEGVTRDRN
jgi:hypothetical protein